MDDNVYNLLHIQNKSASEVKVSSIWIYKLNSFIYINITECPDGTYGIGCQQCSSQCFESRCDKFLDTLNCTDGCIAGYRGTDCSTGRLSN